MGATFSPSFQEFLDSVTDPRTPGGNFTYPLPEILFLSITAALCGLRDWTEIAIFGKSQISWLRKYLPYRNGTPSHDCLGDIFGAIDHQAFTTAFTTWATSLGSLVDGEVIAIDGKTLCGSHDRANGKAAIHLVSAFATSQGITLAQRKVDDKSNEITAIPELLDVLVIQGCLVTIDAMGCQRAIVEKITQSGADFVIALKDNQPSLFEQVQQAFANTKLSDEYAEDDAGHGRVEHRYCQVVTNLHWLAQAANWPEVKAVARLDSRRYDKQTGEEQTASRFYICSITSAQQIHEAVRAHWGIENQLHWVMDVSFGEDDARKREKQSAQNFALVTKTALNMIRQHPSKGSVKGRRVKAAFDTKFRDSLMFT
ncbi:MAG: ISAs1 family transposase [Bacteroidota bacterium]